MNNRNRQLLIILAVSIVLVALNIWPHNSTYAIDCPDTSGQNTIMKQKRGFPLTFASAEVTVNSVCVFPINGIPMAENNKLMNLDDYSIPKLIADLVISSMFVVGLKLLLDKFGAKS